MRLIDADALIADIRKNSVSYFAHEWVDRQPTIEQEPKTGHWIQENNTFTNYCKCSVCGKGDTYMKYKYCPNCGARMNGVSE